MVMEAAPWLAMGQVAGRWVDAGELGIGDDVRSVDGFTGDVESVVVVPVQQWMYNLTVETAHTFFVGQQGWLVHNSGPCNINPSDLKLSDTVLKHLDDVTKKGTKARPYGDSRLVIKEIMEASNPISDPGGLPQGLRWDAPGNYDGSQGIWELAIDTETNTVVHFLFKSN